MNAHSLRIRWLGLVLVSAAAAPASAQSTPAPPEGALVGEFRLEDKPGEINRMIVNVAPASHQPFWLYLDTGATDTVLTPQAARENGVTVRRTKSSPYIQSTSLGVPLRFYVDTRWSDQSSRTGWDYGLLGGRFLAQFVVEFDFDAEVVRFYDPKKFSVPESVTAPDETVVPIRLTNNRPFIKVDVGGSKPLQVLVDTGAPPTILASANALKRVGIETQGLPAYAKGGFTVGTTDLTLKEHQAIRIGSFDLGEVPMEVAPRGAFNLGGNTDSLIGYDIISLFTVRIDYPNRRLWLKRREDARPVFMGTDVAFGQRTGAYISSWSRGYQVNYVRPDSPAAAYGLRTGDYFDALAIVDQKLNARRIVAAIESGATLFGSRPGGGGAMDVEYPGGGSAIPDPSEFTDE